MQLFGTSVLAALHQAISDRGIELGKIQRTGVPAILFTRYPLLLSTSIEPPMDLSKASGLQVVCRIPGVVPGPEQTCTQAEVQRETAVYAEVVLEINISRL